MHRLFAVDLDGTLLRDDGTIAPRDAAAVAEVRRSGGVVAIVTGRLSSGATASSRALGLDTPLVCADGRVVASPADGAPLEVVALDVPLVARTVEWLGARDIEPFVFLHDAIHAGRAARPHGPWVARWTERIVLHPSLASAPSWRRAGEIALALGIAPRDRIEAAEAALAAGAGPQIELACFPLGDDSRWALRVQRRGVDKGSALAKLAARLGFARADVVAIGNGWNDVPMLAWAGRSFAMGQAPRGVRDAATFVLSATSSTGGGVAEALERAG